MSVNLNMGCGVQKFPGFIGIDIRPGHGDITQNMSDPLPFDNDSVDTILCSASFEHLYRHEQTRALKEWYRILKPGGILRIEWLPDFNAIIEEYRAERLAFNNVMGAITGCASSEDQVHKDLFTKERMENLLKQANFKIITLDYCYNVFKENNPWPNNKYSLAIKAMK